MKTFSVKKETLINGRYKFEDIKKHSFAPIDLIERDDYVNGYRVEMIPIYNPILDKKGKYIVVEGGPHDGCIDIYENEIETIVTKEQFRNSEYRLED